MISGNLFRRRREHLPWMDSPGYTIVPGRATWFQVRDFFPFTIAQQWSKCELSTIESPRHGDFELRVMVNTPTNTTEAQHFVLGGYITRVYHTYVYKHMCIKVCIYILYRGYLPSRGEQKTAIWETEHFAGIAPFLRRSHVIGATKKDKTGQTAWGTWCCCDSLQVKLVVVSLKQTFTVMARNTSYKY